MSDRQIQVGDLVQVVKWPCCGLALGVIFKVNEIDETGEWRCVKCKTDHPVEPLAASSLTKNGYSGPISWLKRIPPLSELEGQRTQEDMKEPA